MDLMETLQSAIGPVVLITGGALLLGVMENRFARVVDRSRNMVQKIQKGASVDPRGDRQQLEVFTKRSIILRRSIALISFSLLLDAILVIAIFVIGAFQWDLPWLPMALFVLSMVFLIASLFEYTRDVNNSLHAFRLEVRNERFGAEDVRSIDGGRQG